MNHRMLVIGLAMVCFGCAWALWLTRTHSVFTPWFEQSASLRSEAEKLGLAHGPASDSEHEIFRRMNQSPAFRTQVERFVEQSRCFWGCYEAWLSKWKTPLYIFTFRSIESATDQFAASQSDWGVFSPGIIQVGIFLLVGAVFLVLELESFFLRWR